MGSPKENFYTSTTKVNPHYGPHIWRPGFRRTPWSAILALLVVLVCAVASAAVLAISKGHIANWKLQPSVVLGILSGVGNTALLYAFWKGVNLAWWRYALHGTTLEKLNRIWFCGTSFKSAVFSIRHLNKIGVASIITTIATIAVAPLLQKASRIESGYFVQDVTMNMYLPDQLPDGFTGVHYRGMPGDTLLFPPFLQAMQNWYTGAKIYSLNDYGFTCDGFCEGNVTGPGIGHHDCSITSKPLDLTSLDASGDTLGFSTTFSRFEDSAGTSTLRIKSQYVRTVDAACQATYVTEICDLYTSTVIYPVLYTNDTIFLNRNITVWETSNGEFSSPGDLSTAAFETPAGLLSGLHWFADVYLTATSSIIHDFDPAGRELYIELPRGTLASEALDLNPADYQDSKSQCGFQWFSPTIYILESMTEVSFRAAYSAGLGQIGNTTTLKTFHAVQGQNVAVYHSSYAFLGGALLLLLLAFAAVSSTLYGFWQLGRNTSLSPLETAQALRAPLLADTTTGGDVKKLVNEVGKKEVKYGVFVVNGHEGQMVDNLEIGPRQLLARELTRNS